MLRMCVPKRNCKSALYSTDAGEACNAYTVSTSRAKLLNDSFKEGSRFSRQSVKNRETTIVRPDFQQEYIDISKHVYVQLLTYCCAKQDNVQKVEHVHFVLGDLAQATITLQLKLPIHYSLPDRLHTLQKRYRRNFIGILVMN